MAIQPRPDTPTVGSDDAFAVFKKVEMTQQKTWKFAAVAADETLATATPVGFNEATGNAAKWMAPDPTVVVLNEDGVITVDGQSTGTIDVSAATEDTVKAALLALGIVATVSEATDVFTITLDGDAQVTTVPTVSVTGATNTVTDGTSTYGTHKIKGIVWPEPIDLKAAGEVLGVCMVKGMVDFSEMEAVVDAGDVAALTAACQTELLGQCLNVQNLKQVR